MPVIEWSEALQLGDAASDANHVEFCALLNAVADAPNAEFISALDAFIDLVLEGNLPPTPQQVAKRAGISMATFFRYFENAKGQR